LRWGLAFATLRPSSPKRGLHFSATRRRPTPSAYHPFALLGPLATRTLRLRQYF
jgi:hypothetical protein